MTNVLILGANGQIARFAAELFLKRSDVRLTLYLRNSRRMKNPDPSRARIVDGDVFDIDKLKDAMAGQDVVYANLAGDLEQQANRTAVCRDNFRSTPPPTATIVSCTTGSGVKDLAASKVVKPTRLRNNVDSSSIPRFVLRGELRGER